MKRRHILFPLMVAALACSHVSADLVTARVTPATTTPGKLAVTVDNEGQARRIDIDLSGMAKGTKVRRAWLYAARAEPISGREESALQNIVIAGPSGKALELVAPWFDCFDATSAARPGAVSALQVKTFPKFDPKSVSLLIEYEGKLARPPRQPTGLRVIHRAGQTFVTWKETAPLVRDEEATWGALRKALEQRDAGRLVRYRVYRHTAPITRDSLASAEWLADVAPLSCYNLEGRSILRLIVKHRKRAIDDIPFARKVARQNYFSRYSINMPEMDEVVVDRFVIDDSGKLLPAGSGLYVHNPSKPGRAYYAVATMIDGATNTLEFSLGNATAEPVAETVGPGEPVFQAAGAVKVFYDYPGERRYYVQWTGPPLSNLPNRYYNWSVYIPPDPAKPAPIRMAFTGDEFMRPGVRHRGDTILLAGRDGPLWTGWFGYHEAMGTLKSFRQGRVHPYTANRLFAFLDWAVKAFGGDPKRLSCVGGTEALYYGVRHGDRFAYVLTHAPDPDPQITPRLVRIQGYRRLPPRPQRENVWGKVDWKIPGPGGEPIWDHVNLTKHIAEQPKAAVAFLSMGPAMLSAAWTSQRNFMKQMWASKQPFCAQFFWGGGEPVPVPEGRVGEKDTWDFAVDLPMLALKSNSNDMGLNIRQWTTGEPGYGAGGRIAAGRRWLSDVVDEPDRFEITIHGGGRVMYAGGGTSDVTPRRTQKFKPAPGEKFKWENAPLQGGQAQSGEVTADENGLVTIPGVMFRGPSRLKIYKAQ